MAACLCPVEEQLEVCLCLEEQSAAWRCLYLLEERLVERPNLEEQAQVSKYQEEQLVERPNLEEQVQVYKYQEEQLVERPNLEEQPIPCGPRLK